MHRRSQLRSRRAGFTLIEVLAALVLIGVVLPVAMKGVSIAMQAAAHARHTGEAVELARHKLTELSLSTDSDSYSGAGDFGTDWPEYRFESRMVARDYGINEVTVEVFWKSRGVDDSITLSTLAYPGAYVLGSSTSASTSSDSTTPTGAMGQ